EEVRLKPMLARAKLSVPVTEGAVEVKHNGRWRQVCDASWTRNNSRVVCGMLGFPREKHVNTSFYRKLWNMKLKDQNSRASRGILRGHCTPVLEEQLLGPHGAVPGHRAPPGPLPHAGGPTSPSPACLHPTHLQKGKGRHKTSSGKVLPVRRRAGAHAGEGRVEVLRHGQWGTVCDKRWDLVAASVVCRQLGYGTAKQALVGAQMGQGLGPIHMAEVQCTGHEHSLGECRFQEAERSGCRHEADAAVRCHMPHMDFQSQHADGGLQDELVAEVLLWGGRGAWGSCSAGCMVLLAPFAVLTGRAGALPHTLAQPLFARSGVRCAGTELALQQCQRHGPVHCPSGGGRFSAGVTC
ncbi:Lysyl oxidase 4, partial [Merops nubicus]